MGTWSVDGRPRKWPSWSLNYEVTMQFKVWLKGGLLTKQVASRAQNQSSCHFVHAWLCWCHRERERESVTWIPGDFCTVYYLAPSWWFMCPEVAAFSRCIHWNHTTDAILARKCLWFKGIAFRCRLHKWGLEVLTVDLESGLVGVSTMKSLCSSKFDSKGVCLPNTSQAQNQLSHHFVHVWLWCDWCQRERESERAAHESPGILYCVLFGSVLMIILEAYSPESYRIAIRKLEQLECCHFLAHNHQKLHSNFIVETPTRPLSRSTGTTSSPHLCNRQQNAVPLNQIPSLLRIASVVWFWWIRLENAATSQHINRQDGAK